MKSSQDLNFTGGGRPKNQLLKGFCYFSDFIEARIAKSLHRDVKFPALSMGEMLISLAIIGVLVIILISVIRNVKPDENAALRNKAAYIVNRIVNELSSDYYLYPSTDKKSGLSNLAKVQFNGQTHEGSTKFCTLFASRINKAPGSKVNCSPGQVSVKSIEGFDWYLPISSFDGDQIISVDVNGDKGPNCYASSTCKKPDRFQFQVAPGIRIPVKEIGTLAPTKAPPGRVVIGEPPAPADEKKTGLESYTISCAGANATVFGDGDKKVNGNYTLVAIPKKGYKCNWFIKQVTVKDSNVNDCGLVCTPDNLRPSVDSEPPPPPPPQGDDDDDEEEKTYCVIAEVTGDPKGCTVTGADCGLKSGTNQTVKVKPEKGYTASWESKDVYIKDKDETVTVECTPEEKEECFALKFSGDLEHCPVTVPDANCKKEKNKYKTGKHNYTVTPKEGWSYKDSTDPVNEEILITDKDEEVKIECKEMSLPPVVDIYIDEKFDGLWQDQFRTSNVYYHVYAKRYFDTRTLRVDVPDVYVKLKLTGKYTGEEQYCPVETGICSFTPLTLNENGIEAHLRQPLSQELANGASARWESFQELGLGGHDGSKLIKAVWEKYTLTINDKVYAENKDWPQTANEVLEFKDEKLNTTFKVHINSIPRYMYKFVSQDMDESIVTEYTGFNSYAWIDAKTNVVACASGNCSKGAGNIPGGMYTYFEPNNPHVAHQGERIHVKAGNPFRSCRDNQWHFPTGVYINHSQVCSPPDWNNQAWFECDVNISGGAPYPDVNTIYVKFSSCPAAEYGSSCEGGYPSFPYNASGCIH